jgi:hypothetical protein
LRKALNPVHHIQSPNLDVPEMIRLILEGEAEHHFAELLCPLDSYSSYAVSISLDLHLPEMETLARRMARVSEMKSGMPRLSRTLSFVGGDGGYSS